MSSFRFLNNPGTTKSPRQVSNTNATNELLHDSGPVSINGGGITEDCSHLNQTATGLLPGITDCSLTQIRGDTSLFRENDLPGSRPSFAVQYIHIHCCTLRIRLDLQVRAAEKKSGWAMSHGCFELLQGVDECVVASFTSVVFLQGDH
jgi:hypothetical protein